MIKQFYLKKIQISKSHLFLLNFNIKQFYLTQE